MARYGRCHAFLGAGLDEVHIQQVGEFPVDRAGLLAILDDKDATPALVDLVRSRLPEGERHHSTRELLEALGLARVEKEPGA